MIASATQTIEASQPVPDTAAPDAGNSTASAVSFPNANDYEWKLIASGLNRQVDIQPANDGSGRLFIIEKTGCIRSYENERLMMRLFPRHY